MHNKGKQIDLPSKKIWLTKKNWSELITSLFFEIYFKKGTVCLYDMLYAEFFIEYELYKQQVNIPHQKLNGFCKVHRKLQTNNTYHATKPITR